MTSLLCEKAADKRGCFEYCVLGGVFSDNSTSKICSVVLFSCPTALKMCKIKSRAKTSEC